MNRYNIPKDESKDLYKEVKNNDSSQGDEHNIEYLDISHLGLEIKEAFILYSILSKIIKEISINSESSNATITMPKGIWPSSVVYYCIYSDHVYDDNAKTIILNEINFIAIDWKLETIQFGMKLSILDYFKGIGLPKDTLNSIPRITKEEFYSLT